METKSEVNERDIEIEGEWDTEREREIHGDYVMISPCRFNSRGTICKLLLSHRRGEIYKYGCLDG